MTPNATSTIGGQRSIEPDEFGIEIRFAPHSDAPSRVFHVMSGLIEAIEEIDTMLVDSISTGSSLQPTTLLEDIEAGSLRVWLRNALTSVDDEALKSGEWKKVVGSFLVRAKRIIIDWTERKSTVTSADELDQLRMRLLDEAASVANPPSHHRFFPWRLFPGSAYSPIPAVDVARSVGLISEAVAPLAPADSVRYLSADPLIEISRTFSVEPEVLADILVKESLESQSPMILMVRKPDFLGDTKWEFRHGKQAIEAKISDSSWLAEFRSGTIPPPSRP